MKTVWKTRAEIVLSKTKDYSKVKEGSGFDSDIFFCNKYDLFFSDFNDLLQNVMENYICIK